MFLECRHYLIKIFVRIRCLGISIDSHGKLWRKMSFVDYVYNRKLKKTKNKKSSLTNCGNFTVLTQLDIHHNFAIQRFNPAERFSHNLKISSSVTPFFSL
mmetsp:Transcript_13919/g.16171  ORF Transcript_13919/g.16171 Transcript_13919/m.16171 type:complete len:100 (+) Transcript_13919:335-634(+)